MIIPVRCVTCGRVISPMWDLFKERVAGGEKPEKILDDLGINSYCCRTLFLTHVDLLKEVGRFRF